MTQELSRLRAFVQVVEAGGFSAAAREHGRSKALLSKYVSDLEDHLGVRLMNRTTRKLSLTEAGDSYYRELGGILGELDDLDASIADHTSEARGLLRVSAARNFGETVLAEAVFAFLAENPNVSIDLRLEDRFVDLVDEGIDLAVRITAMPDSSLIARRIADCPMRLVASPALLKQTGPISRPDDLRGHPAIIDTNLQSPSTWRFQGSGQTVNVHMTGRVSVNSPLAAIEAARAGLGFALVPFYVADAEIRDGQLVSLLADAVDSSMSLQAVYPHRRHLAGKVRALIDHLAGWFEKNPLS